MPFYPTRLICLINILMTKITIQSSIAFITILLVYSCSPKPYSFITEADNAQLDYSSLHLWAAHPLKNDPSDLIPGALAPATGQLPVDIFFLHPTTYTGKTDDGRWNARIDDQKINAQTDNSTIKFQASIFNAAGRVYAPRYRQAHINAFYDEDTPSQGQRALDQAYADVLLAFDHYIKNDNQGRPFILASHSQGTVHAARLMKDRIDGTPLAQQFVVAYLVGMPIKKDRFTHFEACKLQSDIGCFVSWRTFKKDYLPAAIPQGDSIVVHNPLSWQLNGPLVNKENSKGAVLRNFDKVYPKAIEAEAHNGVLWTNKPKFPFSFLFTRKNYHIADLNFFYVDVRENAEDRARAFLNKTTTTSNGPSNP